MANYLYSSTVGEVENVIGSLKWESAAEFDGRHPEIFIDGAAVLACGWPEMLANI